MNKEIVINHNHKLKYISFSFNRYIILQLLEIFFTILFLYQNSHVMLFREIPKYYNCSAVMLIQFGN